VFTFVSFSALRAIVRNHITKQTVCQPNFHEIRNSKFDCGKKVQRPLRSPANAGRSTPEAKAEGAQCVAPSATEIMIDILGILRYY
jgi:hypothetical protein